MSETLRVLSYNIHKGFTARNRSFVLSEIRDAIREVHPDFVFLQELLGEHRVHGPQLEFLADTLWPHFAYGRNAVYDEGHHGNAILSKYPILSVENEDVSSSTLERRGLLHAIVHPFEGKDPLHLICAHFGLFERDRQMQAQKLCARLKRAVPPSESVIVAGDFNDWAQRLSPIFHQNAGLSEVYTERHAKPARTFPARFPMLRLDRIYFRSMLARSVECLHQSPWARLSDHAALLAEFSWPCNMPL